MSVNQVSDIIGRAFRETVREPGPESELMESFDVWVRRAAWNATFDLKNEGLI